MGQGEIVSLTDGTQVEGKIQRVGDGWTVTKSDGTVVTVSAEQGGFPIEPSRTTDADSVARDRLDSLRRVADHSLDVQNIIDRYQKFIAEAGDRTVAGEAQGPGDVAGPAGEGDGEAGDQWMTAEAREHRRASHEDEAAPAQRPDRGVSLQGGEQKIRAGVLDDPQSAAALDLRG